MLEPQIAYKPALNIVGLEVPLIHGLSPETAASATLTSLLSYL